MMRIPVTLAVALQVTVGCGSAQTTRPAATTQEAPTSASAPAADPVDPAALAILKRLEAAGRKYPTLRADVEYRRDAPRLGTREDRTGWVAFQNEQGKISARFRIHFETLRQDGGPKRIVRRDYAYPGGRWLLAAKHSTRLLTRYEVVRPGEKFQPWRLGKGPFPLPFGQKVADVLKYYRVSTRPPKPGDPKNTDYLKLTTLRDRRKEVRFRQMELWVDRKKQLPIKIATRDKKRVITTVSFRKIRAGVKIAKEVFEFPRPLGWKEVERSLDDAPSP